jgi:hypothetical protein
MLANYKIEYLLSSGYYCSASCSLIVGELFFFVRRSPLFLFRVAGSFPFSCRTSRQSPLLARDSPFHVSAKSAFHIAGLFHVSAESAFRVAGLFHVSAKSALCLGTHSSMSRQSPLFLAGRGGAFDVWATSPFPVYVWRAYPCLMEVRFSNAMKFFTTLWSLL